MAILKWLHMGDHKQGGGSSVRLDSRYKLACGSSVVDTFNTPVPFGGIHPFSLSMERVAGNTLLTLTQLYLPLQKRLLEIIGIQCTNSLRGQPGSDEVDSK